MVDTFDWDSVAQEVTKINLIVSSCDEKIKEKVFEKLFELRYSNTIPEVSVSQLKVSGTSAATSISSENTNPIDALCLAANLSSDELLSVYDFGSKDKIVIHKTITGTEAEKQRIASKLVLIASEYVLSANQLSGKAIGKYLQELNVDASNLSRNLDTDSDIIKDGNFYRLNVPGKKNTLTLISELAKKQ